jgi:hypothetical protein
VSAPRQPRLPLEPLVVAHGSVTALADALGRPRRQVSRWRSDGIPLFSADLVACALGRHPVEVWPEWFALSEPDAEAA